MPIQLIFYNYLKLNIYFYFLPYEYELSWRLLDFQGELDILPLS